MMSDCVDFYQKQACAGISTVPWLARIQEQACQELERTGFPTRHHEDWKYTSVDAFLQHRFVFNSTQTTDHTINKLARPIPSIPLRIVNGAVIPSEAKQSSGLCTDSSLAMTDSCTTLPSGVIIVPISEALECMPEKIKPYLGQILKQEHAFHALNTAMLHQGLFIYIPDNVSINEPLWLNHWQDKAEQAVNLRHIVVAGCGSRVTLIEDYAGLAETCYFTNTITEIHLAPKATVTHYKIQRESKLAYHVGHLAVQQAEHSQFDSHSICIGSQWMRSDITIKLDEPNARCLMNGLYLPGDGQHMDHHTLVNHAVPDCQSAQDYKGILKGKSRGVFNGRVVVAEGAQHTEAKQQNSNLLLSKNAEIDTKPQLEIFANDVICTHGATVGQLDEDALFYLATRGIAREEASRYLMSAFMNENMRLLANDKLAAWLSILLNEQLG